jgi:class 3 adenylate cyclase
MKGFLSFRAKLILTIFPVVAGVTAAALLLAERKFSRSYEQLFRQQFDTQIAQLLEARETWSGLLSTALESIASHPVVIAGMRNREMRDVEQVLRSKLEEALRERWAIEGAASRISGGSGGGAGLGGRRPMGIGLPGGGGRPGGGLGLGFGKKGEGPLTKGGGGSFSKAGGGSLSKSGGDSDSGRRGSQGGRPPQGNRNSRQTPFVALINPQGGFVKGSKGVSLMPLMMEEGEVAPEVGAAVTRRSGKIPWLGGRAIEDVLDGLKVGYFIVEIGDTNSEQIREVFAVPIYDPDTDAFLGGLVVGVPLSAAGERLLFERTRMGDSGEIRSGMWVEGRLFSSTIPAEYETEIARYVETLEPGTEQSISEDSLEIEGRVYRVLGRWLNPDSPLPMAAQISLYPVGSLHKEIGDLRKSVVGVGSVAMLLAFGLVMFLSRGLSGPINKLVTGVEEIEKGNFGVRVPVHTRDEVGRLGSAFNDMAAGLALQEKYRSVLNAVADRTVAQQLIENESALGGRLQDVTMLFCDIRGFTAITEDMSPAEVIDLLNHHMTAMTDVAYRHGGIVDKFVGDLIMVLFGAPFSEGEDARRAVECACEMQRVRRELNATVAHPLELGIGVATGDVVAGCMGSDQRLSYTVVGARVNLASRLCGAAHAGEIVVDEATWVQVADRVEGEPIQPLVLKGFSEPVPCHRIRPV